MCNHRKNLLEVSGGGSREPEYVALNQCKNLIVSHICSQNQQNCVDWILWFYIKKSKIVFCLQNLLYKRFSKASLKIKMVWDRDETLLIQTTTSEKTGNASLRILELYLSSRIARGCGTILCYAVRVNRLEPNLSYHIIDQNAKIWPSV